MRDPHNTTSIMRRHFVWELWHST